MEFLYRRVDLEDVVSAHLPAIAKAPSILRPLPCQCDYAVHA
jgi:hypothetical protein